MLADIIHKIAGQWQGDDGKYSPRPSMAGQDRCFRSMVYHALGVPREPFPGRTMLIFDDGNWHEELTLDWLRKSVYKIHSQQMHIDYPAGIASLKERRCATLVNGKPCGKVIPAGSLSGHIDAIVTDVVTGQDYLLEHKALNHFTFIKFLDGKDNPNDYFSQMMIYYEALRNVSRLAGAILLIKNKNTSAYLEYMIRDRHVINRTGSNGETIDMDIDLTNSVAASIAKFQMVDECVAAKKLPKRQYHIAKDWQCEYCGWGKLCWKDYKKEFLELRTDTMLPEDVADMLRYYKELGGQKGDIEDEYKNLSTKIKDTLKEIGAREGRAGEYLVKISLIEQSRIDKELLTADEIAKATVRSMQERLYVTAPKEKETKDEQ